MRIETIKEKYNAEIALIVLCCRHYLNTAENGSLQLFIQENKIDWKQFYQLSAAHRIRPIVYKVLDQFKLFIKPENLLELRNYCIYFNAFALNNKRELDRILVLLTQTNILAKSFKGIDFAEKFYGNIGLREFSDNDIIIKSSDIEPIIEMLLNEGYISKDVQFYNKFPKQYIRDYKDLLFEKKNDAQSEFTFEIHFKSMRFFQGYSTSFIKLLGDDYLYKGRHYDGYDYLKLMTLNNGLMDFYPDLRAILDLSVILKKKVYYPINDILSNYINFGKTISCELLNFPCDALNRGCKQNEVKFCSYIQNDILEMRVSKRKLLLQYIYFSIQNSNSITHKIKMVKNFILLTVRPGIDDFASVSLPYHFLYYFTKPFRLVYKLFK